MGFLVWKYWQHFQALGGNTRAEQQKDIKILQENASGRSGETETPLYSELCTVRVSQDAAENHYRGLQRINTSEVYQNVYPMKEREKRHEVYANIGHVRHLAEYLK